MTETPKNTTESQTTTSNTVSRSGGPGGQGDGPPERLAIPIVGIDNAVREDTEEERTIKEIQAYPYNRSLPHETTKHYEAYLHYRDYGPSRTVNITAEAVGLKRSYLCGVATKNHWRKRTMRYLEYMSKYELQLQKDQIKELVKERMSVGTDVLQKGKDALKNTQIECMTPKDVLDFLKTGFTMKGQSLGIEDISTIINLNVNKTITLSLGGETEMEVSLEEAQDRISSMFSFISERGLLAEYNLKHRNLIEI